MRQKAEAVEAGDLVTLQRGVKSEKATKVEPKIERLVIRKPNFEIAEFALKSTSPYVQNAFSGAQRRAMREKQAEGSQQAGKRTKKAPKDFKKLYEEAIHRPVGDEQWYGIPASAFRNAMIRACSESGFKMTAAKMSVFVLEDGWTEDGTPLVKIEGQPHYHEMVTRLETGVADVRARPMWDKWTATIRVRFNRGQFTTEDVANLLLTAGICVGVGEGRPFSPKSCGMGWGTFSLADEG